MHKTKHATEITTRFRELVEGAGSTLADEHYDELSLLIEAAIDTALVDKLETLANKLQKMSHDIRHDAEFFD